jgi:hypothetical protein
MTVYEFYTKYAKKIDPTLPNYPLTIGTVEQMQRQINKLHATEFMKDLLSVQSAAFESGQQSGTGDGS